MEEPTAETVEEVFEEVAKLTPWGFLAWLGFLLPGKSFLEILSGLLKTKCLLRQVFKTYIDCMTLTRLFNFVGLPQNHFIFQKSQIWASKLCVGLSDVQVFSSYLIF